MRCKSENRAAEIIVSEALERGFEISVTSYRANSPSGVLQRESDADMILKSLDSGGEMDRIGLVDAVTGKETGYLYLEYGECRDLIVDYPEGNLDCNQIAHAVKAELA